MRCIALSMILLTVPTVVGCLGDDTKGAEEELDLLDDSKADSHRSPTEHGQIAFATPADTALTTDERFHAWWFDLSGDAKVDMTTSYVVRGQRRTDTVMYFYKQQADGRWGSYVARNDDYGDTTYSQLKKTLTAGRYRVIVKGYDEATRGKFRLTVNCLGEGCAPPAPASTCLYGGTYHEMLENPAFMLSERFKITPTNIAQLSEKIRQRVLRAVKESSHTDVTTPEEALSRVDEDEINLYRIYDNTGRRTFMSFEYGAGDNSYGAIFDDFTDEKTASIHDGDLYECTVEAETCLLPQDWSELRNDATFERTATTVVTDAAQITGVQAEQALSVFRQSYDDVTTVADGLSRVDENKLNFVSFTHRTTGTRIEVVEYGAGDTSVGGIFYAGTTNRAGTIEDLFIYGCSLFAN